MELAEELSPDPEDAEDIEDDTLELMHDYDVDQDTAEKAKELIDEGADEDGAVKLAEEL